MSGQSVAVVVRLLRYPVKSMGGEDLQRVEAGPRGFEGDRAWAVRTPDGGIGSGKTTRRFRRVDGLLDLRATSSGDVPTVHLPTGVRVRADDAAADDLLSSALRTPVVLRREGDVPHHDESPLHVVTSAALDRLGMRLGGPVDVVRFRPNLVLDTDGDELEAGWTGRELRLGDDVVLRLGPGMVRCRMVDLPQRGIARDGRILTELGGAHAPVFGLQATVVRSGTAGVGDVARLV